MESLSQSKSSLGEKPTDLETLAKVEAIRTACKLKNVGQLRTLADSAGGLLEDELRRKAWPILLGLLPLDYDSNDEKNDVNIDLFPAIDGTGEWKKLPPHRDEYQVSLDVHRAFVYYPTDLSEAQLQTRKVELSDLITAVLRHHPFLCYFQGYHDIAQVLLLILPPQMAFSCLAQLSILRIRDFMLPTLGPTTTQLRLLPDIIKRADPKLRRYLADVEPYYALSGTLTMYAHDIMSLDKIARLFDVFLAREPVFSIYVFAQIVINRRDEVFEYDDGAILQAVLNKFPATMDLDLLIANSVNLYDNCSPETLSSWRQISSSSVLKTARNVEDCEKETLEEGAKYFDKQSAELRWVDIQDRVKATIWLHRRQATLGTAAIAVGIMGIYLARSPSALQRVTSFINYHFINVT